MFQGCFWRCAQSLRQNWPPVSNHSIMGKPKSGRRPPAAKKPPLTHFLCLPLVTSESRPRLEIALNTFKEGVSQQVSAGSDGARQSGNIVTTTSGIDPKSIRPVGALHCTLGVMSLDDKKLSEAIEFLQSIDVRQVLNEANGQSADSSDAGPSTTSSSTPTALARPISPPNMTKEAEPLVIDLKGILPMHAPQKTSILYAAPTEPSGRLLPFCLGIQKLFQAKGFLVEDTRELKLHATIVNTIYAKARKRPPPRGSQASSAGQESSGHGPNANSPLKIDATAILENYKDFRWAEGVVLDRIAICEMGAKKITNSDGEVLDQEYTEVATIQLPT